MRVSCSDSSPGGPGPDPKREDLRGTGWLNLLPQPTHADMTGVAFSAMEHESTSMNKLYMMRGE